MSDVTVQDTTLQPAFPEVIPFQRMEIRRLRRSARTAKILSAIQAGAIIALSVAVCDLVNTMRVVPVIAFTNEMGLMDEAYSISDLPTSQQEAGVQAMLWQYVWHREHYAAADILQDFAIVKAMSVPAIAEAYDRWANPRSNPHSPAKELGPNGFIRVNRIYGAFLNHSADFTSGRYLMRFCRLVVRPDQGNVIQRISVTLSYTTVNKVPLWERLTWNAPGIVVTEYAAPEQEGLTREVTGSGGINPCA